MGVLFSHDEWMTIRRELSSATETGMKATIASALLVVVSMVANSEAGRWQPGLHYTVLKTPQPTSVRPGEVEVVEVLSYTCSACYSFDPFVTAWLKQKPAYVRFTRVPAVWDENRRGITRMYYALEALGRADLHSAILELLHKNKQAFNSSNATDAYKLHAAFAQRNGVDISAFRKAYESTEVGAKVNRAELLLRGYRIEHTPTMVINGKFTSTLLQAQGDPPDSYAPVDYQRLLSLTTDLAAAEQRARRPVASPLRP
jgi:thiol:disulfide interchange protein DsbA